MYFSLDSCHKKTFPRRFIMQALRLLSFFALGFFIFPSSALSQTVQVDNNPPYDIALQNVTVNESKVSGQIVNKSPNPVQNVQLLIRRTWLWENEFHPGPTNRDPGTADYVTIKGEIGRGQSMPFSNTSSPPRVSNVQRRFMTEVSVAGFSEVIYSTR
jgi:hypothetical protein